jgi:ABC-2 type transport system permease protein
MNDWKEFFDMKVTDTNESIIGSVLRPEKIVNSILVLLIHIVGFVTAAILIFKKKDILS